MYSYCFFTELSSQRGLAQRIIAPRPSNIHEIPNLSVPPGDLRIVRGYYFGVQEGDTIYYLRYNNEIAIVNVHELTVTQISQVQWHNIYLRYVLDCIRRNIPFANPEIIPE